MREKLDYNWSYDGFSQLANPENPSQLQQRFYYSTIWGKEDTIRPFEIENDVINFHARSHSMPEWRELESIEYKQPDRKLIVVLLEIPK